MLYRITISLSEHVVSPNESCCQARELSAHAQQDTWSVWSTHSAAFSQRPLYTCFLQQQTLCAHKDPVFIICIPFTYVNHRLGVTGVICNSTQAASWGYQTSHLSVKCFSVTSKWLLDYVNPSLNPPRDDLVWSALVLLHVNDV